MIFGYIRVSSDKQSVENQRFEIQKFCDLHTMQIDEWCEETVTGTREYSKRRLGNLIKKVKNNDIIICTEISRLGRNLYMIMDILHVCMDKNCQVWTIKDGFRLGDDIQSKILAFAFALSAEIERKLISQRTREALQRLRAEGTTLGRPKGSKSSIYKLSPHRDKVISLYSNGKSINHIAKKFKVSHSTVKSFLIHVNIIR